MCGRACGDPGLESVVIKRFKAERERGLDGWASLEFLTRLGLEPPLVPRFLGGDLRAGLFVMGGAVSFQGTTRSQILRAIPL